MDTNNNKKEFEPLSMEDLVLEIKRLRSGLQVLPLEQDQEEVQE